MATSPSYPACKLEKTMIRKLATTLVLLAGLLSFIAGVKYLSSSEFTTYHAVVVGKSWSQIEPGVKSIILGMLTIVGSGYMATGLAILFLLIPIRRGELWAYWATLAVTLANWIPALYVTIALRRINPAAETPVIPAIIGVVKGKRELKVNQII